MSYLHNGAAHWHRLKCRRLHRLRPGLHRRQQGPRRRRRRRDGGRCACDEPGGARSRASCGRGEAARHGRRPPRRGRCRGPRRWESRPARDGRLWARRGRCLSLGGTRLTERGRYLSLGGTRLTTRRGREPPPFSLRFHESRIAISRADFPSAPPSPLPRGFPAPKAPRQPRRGPEVCSFGHPTGSQVRQRQAFSKNNSLLFRPLPLSPRRCAAPSRPSRPPPSSPSPPPTAVSATDARRLPATARPGTDLAPVLSQ